MPRSRKLGKYPLSFHDVLRRFKEEGEFMLDMNSEVEASRLRYEFYGFFNALNREGHELAQTANSCIMRVKGNGLWFEGPDTHPAAQMIEQALAKHVKVGDAEIQASQARLVQLMKDTEGKG